MRSITFLTILLIMLLSAASAYDSVASPGQTSMSGGYSEPTVLCLNRGMSTDRVDVSMTPVYDWVHAGQQGIRFTVTNKANENLRIDWDQAARLRGTIGTVAGEGSTSSMESNYRELYDDVAPGATFSKVLWPRSISHNARRLETRGVRLTFSNEKSGEQHQELVLDVAGKYRVCSR